LAFGSFINVVVYRVPRGESLIMPASHCPHCQHPIRPWDNIPLISWIILKGHCRDCGAPISFRYPLVEMLAAVLLLLSCYKYGVSASFAFYSILLLGLLALSLIDLEHYLLPNRIVIPLWIFGLVFEIIFRVIPLWKSLLGMVVGGGILVLVAYGGKWLFGKEAMGGGDIKLTAMMGVYVGWPNVLLLFFLAAVLASVVGVALMIGWGKKGRDPIPFGPFLALGCVLTLLWGTRLLDWYLGFFPR
jgi:leader peptidase (prepilin peptidase)/N-methyltransferase